MAIEATLNLSAGPGYRSLTRQPDYQAGPLDLADELGPVHVLVVAHGAPGQIVNVIQLNVT